MKQPNLKPFEEPALNNNDESNFYSHQNKQTHQDTKQKRTYVEPFNFAISQVKAPNGDQEDSNIGNYSLDNLKSFLKSSQMKEKQENVVSKYEQKQISQRSNEESSKEKSIENKQKNTSNRNSIKLNNAVLEHSQSSSQQNNHGKTKQKTNSNKEIPLPSIKNKKLSEKTAKKGFDSDEEEDEEEYLQMINISRGRGNYSVNNQNNQVCGQNILDSLNRSFNHSNQKQENYLKPEEQQKIKIYQTFAENPNIQIEHEAKLKEYEAQEQQQDKHSAKETSSLHGSINFSDVRQKQQLQTQRSEKVEPKTFSKLFKSKYEERNESEEKIKVLSGSFHSQFKKQQVLIQLSKENENNESEHSDSYHNSSHNSIVEKEAQKQFHQSPQQYEQKFYFQQPKSEQSQKHKKQQTQINQQIQTSNHKQFVQIIEINSGIQTRFREQHSQQQEQQQQQQQQHEQQHEQQQEQEPQQKNLFKQNTLEKQKSESQVFDEEKISGLQNSIENDRNQELFCIQNKTESLMQDQTNQKMISQKIQHLQRQVSELKLQIRQSHQIIKYFDHKSKQDSQRIAELERNQQILIMQNQYLAKIVSDAMSEQQNEFLSKNKEISIKNQRDQDKKQQFLGRLQIVEEKAKSYQHQIMNLRENLLKNNAFQDKVRT